MRVDLLEQLDELERGVVRSPIDGLTTRVTQGHHGENPDRGVLDAAEPTVDEVGQALVEGALLELVAGQGLGDARCRTLAHSLDVVDQVEPGHEHQRNHRCDVGVLERLHQVDVVAERVLE